MLCYRCGSHVPDNAESCASCGQKLTGGGVRQATGTFSRKRPGTNTIEGAPYKPDETIAGRYLIKDTIGQGPLGFVFRAHDQEVDVEVAIKVINPRLAQTPDERKQFSKVMRQGRKLTHPHMARIYEEGEDQDRPFYTSQFLEGLTLRKIIDLRIGKGQFFALKEIEPIFVQVVNALDGAHQVGIHSDLKPENIIVLPDLLKVTDFGLGLAIPRLPFVQALKSRKADRYLAPELVENREVDHRADLYSLGVIFGEMLSGLTPDGSVPELARRNPDVPGTIEGLYRKALSHNPLARFGSALEFLEEFNDALRRVSPPPIKVRPEPASGVGPRVRSGSLGGAALQLSPRRPAEKPGPPVASIHEDEDTPPPDATQPMDPAMIPGLFAPVSPVKDRRSEPMSSGPSQSSGPGEVAPPLFAAVSGGRTTPQFATLWLVVLTLLGLLIGSAGGYYVLQRMRARSVVVTEVSPPTEPSTQAEPPPSPSPSTKPAEPSPAVVSPAPVAVTPKTEPSKKPPPARIPPDLQPERTPEKKPREPEGSKLAAARTAPTDASGCPSGMSAIPSGSFRMGTAKDDPMMGFDERGLASVEVAAFCIDQFEYPNRRGVNPVVSVSWADAKRLCEGKGKRLCSEEEWEKACKGPGNARFPYGSTYDPNACNTEDEAGDDRQLAVSGQFAKCRSGYGVADLSGNVAEWTSTPYTANADKAQKGGAFNRPDYAARCSARKNGSPSSRSAEVGFRCCAEAGK